jgi:pimeloyl-ACP methyl ester carboxylesterase
MSERIESRQNRRWAVRLRRLAVAVAAGAVATGVVVPAGPAAAVHTSNPVLVVGGHFTTTAMMEGDGVLYPVAKSLKARMTGDVTTLELSNCLRDTTYYPCNPPPLEAFLVDHPGTGSNYTSAVAIRAKVAAIAARTGRKVDLVGISQGALAIREYITSFPEEHPKVGAVISYHGVPEGISSVGTGALLKGYCTRYSMVVCDEIMYGAGGPGDNPYVDWYLDPAETPEIPYYHIRSDLPGEAAAERAEQIVWGGATNWSVQQLPPPCDSRSVQHAEIAEAAMVRLLNAARDRSGFPTTCPAPYPA